MINLQRLRAILLWIPLVYFMDRGVNFSVSVFVNDNNVSFVFTFLLDILTLLVYNSGYNLFRKTFDTSEKVDDQDLLN
jgi:hypothetical protein